MNISECQFLDDYLDHDLAQAEVALFVAHLSKCPNCRQAVAEQHRFETLLADATSRLEPVPSHLVPRIKSRVRMVRRRRWAGIGAGLAASVAVAWLISRYLPLAHQFELPVEKGPTELSPSLGQPPFGQVRITFPAGANVLIVREKSESPNVTFIQIYSGLCRAPSLTKGRSSSIPERSHE
jgi:hypothetical protein